MKASAATVLAALRAGPYREPAHAWLFNVRNQTGYSRRQRYADALVVSLWPSRGIWIAGIEVKVDRADWRRELDEPEKAAEIFRFCNYWAVAAPTGVVELGEVPPTWGFFEIEKRKVHTRREPPMLSPEPLTPTFIASVLRNVSQQQGALRKVGYDEGWAARSADLGLDGDNSLEKQIADLKNAVHVAERARDMANNDLATMQQRLASFEREAGLEANTIAYGSVGHGVRNLGATFRAAQALAAHPPEHLEQRFRAVADALAALTSTTEAAE